MEQKLDIACVVLAGGGSTRFGSDKGLALLGGRPLIAHVVEGLLRQTRKHVAVNAPAESRYSGYGDIRLPDERLGGLGPLAGLYTALSWANSYHYKRVVTCAVDTPFLPDDFLRRLAAETGPAVVSSLGRRHPVCGIWPVELLPELKTALDGGMRAARDWADLCGTTEVAFARADGRDPFFNINTTEDLAEASRF